MIAKLVPRLSKHVCREAFADFREIRENPSRGVSPLLIACSPKREVSNFAQTAGSNRQTPTKRESERTLGPSFVRLQTPTIRDSALVFMNHVCPSGKL